MFNNLWSSFADKVLKWFAGPSLPATAKVIEIEPGLDDSEVIKLLAENGFPKAMKKIPVKNISTENLISLIDKSLRGLMSIDMESKLSIAKGGDYRVQDLSVEERCKLAQRYLKLVASSDKVLYNPDPPCIVCHDWEGSSTITDRYYLCHRISYLHWVHKWLEFECTPQMSSRRWKQENNKSDIHEKSVYGDEGHAIIKEARNAAIKAMSDLPDSSSQLSAFVNVNAKINGIDFQWGSSGGERTINAGAQAFMDVLSKHGIESSRRGGID